MLKASPLPEVSLLCICEGALGDEEEIRGAAMGEDLAALVVKWLKREALLEITKADGANLTDYESARSTKTGLQKTLWRDRLE